ncbi:MAG: hypothetical protein AAGF85_15065 [Bacteroidota bacterium]
MKRVVLSLVSFIVATFSALGSHIVGGEFELIYQSGNTYRLNLIIYYDEINGNPGARYAPQPVAWIYRKSDNMPMRTVNLPLISEEDVLYSIPECTDDNIVRTDRQVWSALIDLDPTLYNDPGGYYISWQRCCRNYNINNIVSEDPNAGGEGSGQTFYLEFPAVEQNGEPFINSSPQLFPPLSDYGCVNRFYFADFTGTDPDGDSLVYSIVTPLNTPDATPHPQPPSTAPYDLVRWTGGFSESNIMGGDPDISISDNGLLTVTPQLEGIFVFGVKCDEYRDGVKIGEVRRDFQMVVVDCPEPGNQPDIDVTLEDGSPYSEGDTLRFATDDTKCVTFDVEDSKGGKVRINGNPIGYDEENFTLTIIGTSPTGDRLTAEVCFTDCPPTRDLPFQVDFIGLDNTCPQPLQDTVRLTVAITPPPNELPVISHKEDVQTSYSTTSYRKVTVQEEAGGVKVTEIVGLDANNDSIDFFFEPIGFELGPFGFSIIEKENREGRNETWLEWNYDCEQTNFDEANEFRFEITAEDRDDCLYEDPILFILDLEVILPPNTEPVIFSEFSAQNQDYLILNYKLLETVDMDIFGIDLDNDQIAITGQGINFDFTSFGIDFEEVRGSGADMVTNNFLWDIPCSINLAEQDTFRAQFFVEDFDKCQITNTDTLTVDFVLEPTASSDPLLTYRSVNSLQIQNEGVELLIGDQLEISVEGRDFEGDSLELFLLDAPELSGLEFEPAFGVRSVSSDFIWSPDCSVFTDSNFSEEFIFSFVLLDKNCYLPKSDTISLMVTIEDIPQRDEFAITNVITPKTSPDQNDYFGYYTIENPSEDDRLIYLPIDNCAGRFEEVIIHNRWGQTVFSSTDRDFKWFANNVSAGIYYYTILYSNSKYQGPLTVLF